jgi:hypothetical protein
MPTSKNRALAEAEESNWFSQLANQVVSKQKQKALSTTNRATSL